jgi:hypothetical protein
MNNMKQKILSLLVLLMTVATGAWAAITTEDIGKVICTDGSLYATKILAQNDGKTAAAMIGYVDTENNKALAIALTDGNNNMDWTQASEYCTGLNTSLPVPNGTWVLPTEEQWNSVLTLEEVVPGYEAYKSESLNTKLNAAKADALNNDGESYWSATELPGGNYVKCFSFNYGMASVGMGRKAATDGSMTRAFLEIELSGIEVTTNAASEGATFTEASFQMPTYDVTIDYELVRDMEVDINAVMADRIRIKKSGSTYTPVDLLSVIPTVTDKLDAQNPVEMEWGTDYEMTLEKKGENNEWVATTDYSVGTFRAVIHGLNLYDGITYTNEFQLFEGYEVEVAAGEYVTYYKEENLYVEDEDAELYTITSVGSETATATELTIAKAYTPILVKNKGAEKKVILLIPTVTEGDDVTAAPEFIGTLEATTIAASSENQNNYAFNGLQFVWVKNAIDIAANRAWLSINTGVPSARGITLVFDETTKIANTNITNITNGNWYDLNGRKLQNIPTKKGVYIMNGRKVVVK